MDALSRKKLPKEALYRFVLQGSTYVYDEKNTLPGRGLYLTRDKEALKEAVEKKTILRATRGKKIDEAFLKEVLRNG